jgi:hypothetical protein
MKKTCIFTVAMLVFSLGCMAQYQLPNGGFEQWDGSSATSEPSHWNSFATADGSYSSMASSPHHYHRHGGRPGTSGSSYLTIYTKSIVGIKANGNMTTGRIHAGSMSATSSDNYNYTQRSNSAHCQPFSGTPDSMYFWVSYYAKSSNSQAQVSAILHGDSDFQSPNHESNSSLYKAKAVARFTRTTSSASSMQWKKKCIPFVYDGNSSVNYVLLNITTNATPGGGDGNDSLSIDDIEFIYSAWLNGITVDGAPIAGFSKGVMNYKVHVDNLEAEVDGITEVSDAVASIGRQNIDDTTVLVSIDVTAEDGVTARHYTITLTTGQVPVGIAPVDDNSKPLQIYPNPATDIVTVWADGLLELLDLEGRLLQQHQVHGQTQLNISNLPAGTYLLRCGKAATKIIKY